MRRIFLVEWRKHSLFKNITLLLISGFLIFFVTYFCFSNALSHRSFRSENYKHLAESLQEEDIPTLNLELEDPEKTGKNHIRKLVDLFEKQRVVYNNLALAMDEDNPEDILKYELENTNLDIYSHEASLLIGHPIDQLRETSLFYQYLYDNNIYMPDTLSQMNGLYMLYFLLVNIFPILVPGVVLFITSSTISKEKSQGTLKFLLQQPYSRRKVLLSKMAVSGLLSFLILSVTCLFQFVIASIIGGIGYGKYPVKSSASILTSFFIGEKAYLPLSTYLIYVFGILCITIVFYTALATFISIISENVTISFLLSVVAFSVPIVLKASEINLSCFINDINSILTNNVILLPIGFYLLVSIILIWLSLSIFKRKNIYS